MSADELAKVKSAANHAKEVLGKQLVKRTSIKQTIDTVKQFIRQRKLLIYGGTAVNDILPTKDQFYDRHTEIPDYDFFSPDAMHDAIRLADLFFKRGFRNIEAKAGQHHGTYKVFVEFLPVADITDLNRTLYRILQSHATSIDGLLYTPHNYLRMSMYNELANPKGDVSRWEKVASRLIVFNKKFPIVAAPYENKLPMLPKPIHDVLCSLADKHEAVYFGGHAMKEYGASPEWPQFYLLSNNHGQLAHLLAKSIPKATAVRKAAFGENIGEHYVVQWNKRIIAIVFKPTACHNYNLVRGQRIATIDTIMRMYLALMYTDRPYIDIPRILSMAQQIYNMASTKKPVAKRYSLTCVGHQPTKEEIMAEKQRVRKQFSSNVRSSIYNQWFLKYNPNHTSKKQSSSKPHTHHKPRTHHQPRTQRRKKTNYKSFHTYRSRGG